MLNLTFQQENHLVNQTDLQIAQASQVLQQFRPPDCPYIVVKEWEFGQVTGANQFAVAGALKDAEKLVAEDSKVRQIVIERPLVATPQRTLVIQVVDKTDKRDAEIKALREALVLLCNLIEPIVDACEDCPPIVANGRCYMPIETEYFKAFHPALDKAALLLGIATTQAQSTATQQAQ